MDYQFKEQWNLINEARAKVPVVNYALAVAAMAACSSIVIFFFGDKRTAILAVALILVGAILVFIFSRAASSRDKSTKVAGQVFIWSVLVFFISFMGLTISAFSAGWPCNWARVVGASDGCQHGQQALRSCQSLEASAWRSIDQRKFCEDARDLANEMVQRCPDLARNYNTLGAAQYCLGEFDAAIQNWKVAEKNSSSPQKYKRNIGAAFIRTKNFSAARNLYEELYLSVKNTGKFNASVTYNYALALLLSKKAKRANEKYTELLQVDTHRIKARFGIIFAQLLEAKCVVSKQVKKEISDVILLQPSLALIAKGQIPAGDTVNHFEPYVWLLNDICPVSNPFDI